MAELSCAERVAGTTRPVENVRVSALGLDGGRPIWHYWEFSLFKFARH